MEIKRNVRKIAELGIVVTTLAALLVAGCGGGGALGLGGGSSSSTLFVSGAGNSPFIGVTMKAECANGTTGTGVIGTDSAPGDGTITVAGTCTAPIKITAISRGKMRPIGATSAVSDVDYNPDTNLPISNILTTVPSTAATAATANPVTTLVANQVVGTSSVAAALTAIAANSAVLNTAQTNVASSVGITAAQINDDYRNPLIAKASTTIADVVAIAVAQAAASSGVTPAAVTSGTKTLGQFVAEKLSAAGSNLQSASSVAAQINSGANIDIRTDNRVTGGSIDRDASNVRNMIAQAANDDSNTVKNSVADMLKQVAANSSVAVTTARDQHAQEARLNEVMNIGAKLVADAIAASGVAGVSATEKQTRLAVAQETVAKITAGITTAIANAYTTNCGDGCNTTNLNRDTNNVIAQYKVVANGVIAAFASDLASTSAHVFATPPTVGVTGVVDILVGKLQSQASGVTATNTLTDAAAATAATAAAKSAMTVVTAIKNANFEAPPAIGGASAVAYNVALTTLASKIGDAEASKTPAQLQAAFTSLQAAVVSGVSGVVVTTANKEEYEEHAAATVKNTLASIDIFAAPPAPGSITQIALPPALPTVTAPQPVTMNAVTQAQKDAATAAQAQAVSYAAAAAQQASNAAAAYTQAVALSTETATAVGPAQAAANAAQTAATAAHAARLAAEAAAATAASAFPNSVQATDAAAKAAAAIASDILATERANAAKACYDALVARLMAAQVAAAQAFATHAAGDATTAAQQAALAASASASAVAATTYTAAGTFATAAADAATVAQAAATHAAADAAGAALQLPGTPPASSVTAAAASAQQAQASATAAAASVVTANTAATPVGAPTNVTATKGDASATVSFTAPAGTIIDYNVFAFAAGVQTSISQVGHTSPITVTGLTNGTAYTFKVKATTAKGTSDFSVASAAVTPTAAPLTFTTGTGVVALTTGGAKNAYIVLPAVTLPSTGTLSMVIASHDVSTTGAIKYSINGATPVTLSDANGDFPATVSFPAGASLVLQIRTGASGGMAYGGVVTIGSLQRTFQACTLVAAGDVVTPPPTGGLVCN